MQNDNTVQQIFWFLAGGFGISIPVILVWLAGVALAIINWRKTPRASLLTLAAMLVFLINLVLSNLIRAYPLWAQMRGESIGWFYTTTGFVTTLVSAAGFGLLLAAIWSGRENFR